MKMHKQKNYILRTKSGGAKLWRRRIISLVLVQVMLLSNAALAGEIFYVKQIDCLSPELTLHTSIIQDGFRAFIKNEPFSSSGMFERLHSDPRLAEDPLYEISQYAFAYLEAAGEKALERYSNVHRGTGQHSLISTWLFDYARDIVLEYLDLDPKEYIVIFGGLRRLETLKAQIKQKGKRCSVLESNKDFGLPLGVGALAVRKKDLPRGVPFQTGGGTVKLVSRGFVIWADAPERFEAGTPNIMGIILFAKALRISQNFNCQDVFKQRKLDDSIKADVITEEILSADDFEGLSGEELFVELSKSLVGGGVTVPTLEGDIPYINFDNGASTPTFEPVWQAVCKTWRSQVDLSTAMPRAVKDITSRFFGAPQGSYDITFTSNATEGVNVVASNIRDSVDEETEVVVINTLLEHNSNELPWRTIPGVKLIRLPVDEVGFIELEQLRKVMQQYVHEKKKKKQRIIVAVSGASNVLGTMNNISEISEIVHDFEDAELLVDAAQLAAHANINMERDRIDHLVFSGHKIYAPFGSGGLISRKGLLDEKHPDLVHARLEGVRNLVGLAALGKSMDLIMRIGRKTIEHKEQTMTKRLLEGLADIPGVRVYGVSNPESERMHNRGPVVAFSVDGIPHNIVAWELAERGGIGVRNGCFCAHLPVKEILGVSWLRNLLNIIGVIIMPRLTHAFLPGLVRVSLGIENTQEEIDHFLSTLREITQTRVSVINRLLSLTHNGSPFVPFSLLGKDMVDMQEKMIEEVYLSLDDPFSSLALTCRQAGVTERDIDLIINQIKSLGENGKEVTKRLQERITNRLKSRQARGVLEQEVRQAKNKKEFSRSIIRIVRDNDVEGSAFVIAETPDYYILLSNTHVAKDKKTVILTTNSELVRAEEFVVALNEGIGKASVVLRHIEDLPVPEDIAIFAISKKEVERILGKGEKLKRINLISSFKEGEFATVVSGRNGTVSTGELVSIGSMVILLDSHVVGGDSGSPILIKTENGYSAVAVSAQGGDTEVVGVIGVRITPKIIKDMLAALEGKDTSSFKVVTDDESLKNAIKEFLLAMFNRQESLDVMQVPKCERTFLFEKDMLIELAI